MTDLDQVNKEERNAVLDQFEDVRKDLLEKNDEQKKHTTTYHEEAVKQIAELLTAVKEISDNLAKY